MKILQFRFKNLNSLSGEWLLVDALNKFIIASDTVAFPLILVDTKDGVSQFYEQMGFVTFLDSPNKLFMTLADVRKSLI